MKLFYSVLLFTFFSLCTVAQENPVIDSLNRVLAQTESDSVKKKVKVLYLKYKQYLKLDSLDSALSVSYRIVDLGKKKENIENVYLGVSYVSSVLNKQKKYKEVEQIWDEFLDYIPSNDTVYKAKAYKQLGMRSYYKNDYANALKHFFKAVHYDEMLGDAKSSYQWVVYCYSRLNDVENAAKFNKEVIRLAKEDSSFLVLGRAYIGQGYYLMNLNRFVESYDFSKKAVAVYFNDLKDTTNGELGVAYGNIADVFIHYYKYAPDSIVYVNSEFKKVKNLSDAILDSAKYYIDKSAQIASKHNHNQRDFYVAFNYGDLYYYQGKIKKSEKEFLKCYAIAKKLSGMATERKRVAKQLYKVYKKLNNTDKALAFHEEYIMLKDSLLSTEKQKELGKQEALFEFEKQKTQEALEREKQKAIREAEFEHAQDLALEKERNQRIITYAVLFVLLLISVFTVVIFKRLKIARRQQVLIREQKQTIEQNRNQMLDSIEYSKKIQQRIFPTMEKVKAIFPKSFVYFQPKDVVSGDFYWVYKKGNRSYFAVADCTGHGVPGAFMTLISLNLLNSIIVEEVYNTAELLERLHEKLKKRMSSSEEDKIKHGLDIAMCCYNAETNELEYSGLHNPLYLVDKENVLTEYKGNKLFLGISSHFEVTLHRLKVNRGDTVYLSTDGFPDQKGGEKGKKYYYKRFRNLIIEVNKLPIEERRDKLKFEFERWKGDREQIDDVCIMGVEF